MCELFKRQNGKCALSGRQLNFSKNKKEYLDLRTTTASLDRIDSSKEYTEENVRWVHKDINKFKSNLTQKQVFDIVKEIYFYMKDKYE